MTRESDFQRSVMDLAELSGWETLHVRTSMQAGRYLTAVTGTMGKGFPDLLLVKGSRLIFAELKSDKGRIRPDQERVLSVLRNLEDERVAVYTWRPKDWPRIERLLAGVGEKAA